MSQSVQEYTENTICARMFGTKDLKIVPKKYIQVQISNNEISSIEDV